MENDEFVEVLLNFYEELLSKQESLEKEFESVLFENVWEFYVE